MSDVHHLIDLNKKEKYYTPKEIADSLGVTSAAVTNWLNQGKLRGFRLGGSKRSRWKIKGEDVFKFVEECTYG